MKSINVTEKGGRKYNIPVETRRNYRVGISLTKADREFLDKSAKEMDTSIAKVISGLIQLARSIADED